MVVMSDIHFRDSAPVWRSPEQNWQGYMSSIFDEISEVVANCHESAQNYDSDFCIGVAGDVFDKWNPTIETIVTATSCFQKLVRHSSSDRIYCVPGQHDLPNHSYAEQKRSAYGLMKLLVKEWRDIHLLCKKENKTYIHGVGWEGHLTNDFKSTEERDRSVVLLHRYVWMQGCSYAGAPKTDGCASVAKELKRPALIVSGDNHIGFWDDKHSVFNCGSLYRATKDQLHYKPRIGIITNDLQIFPYYLNTSSDSYLTVENATETLTESVQDVDGFLQELRQMGRGGLDYLEAIKRYCKSTEVARETRLIIREILEKSDGPSKKTRATRKR